MLVGIDVDEGTVRHPLLTYRVKAICGQMPFKDGSFDLVTANMVVEHVTDPDSFLSDVSRVLRPGGRFLFVTPNFLLYLLLLAARLVPDAPKKRIVSFLERRKEEDIFPTHYRMNSPQAIQNYAGKTGFHVEQLNLIGSNGSLSRLGPVSWIECLLLKGLESSFHGKMQPDILAVLAREKAA